MAFPGLLPGRRVHFAVASQQPTTIVGVNIFLLCHGGRSNSIGLEIFTMSLEKLVVAKAHWDAFFDTCFSSLYVWLLSCLTTGGCNFTRNPSASQAL